jgi:hypothetical protein
MLTASWSADRAGGSGPALLAALSSREPDSGCLIATRPGPGHALGNHNASGRCQPGCQWAVLAACARASHRPESGWVSDRPLLRPAPSAAWGSVGLGCVDAAGGRVPARLGLALSARALSNQETSRSLPHVAVWDFGSTGGACLPSLRLGAGLRLVYPSPHHPTARRCMEDMCLSRDAQSLCLSAYPSLPSPPAWLVPPPARASKAAPPPPPAHALPPPSAAAQPGSVVEDGSKSNELTVDHCAVQLRFHLKCHSAISCQCCRCNLPRA